jgi:hypothetical protein
MAGHVLELAVAIGIVAGGPLDGGSLGRVHRGRQHGGGVGGDRHGAFGHAGGHHRHEHQQVARQRFHVLVDGIDARHRRHGHAIGRSAESWAAEYCVMNMWSTA